MKHRTKILRVAFLLALFSIYVTSISGMTPELEEDVLEWIETHVRAERTEVGDYWSSLKALGEKVDEDTASRLAQLESYETVEAIALMAYEVAQHPERARELTEWYGRWEFEIREETAIRKQEELQARGASRHELLEPFISKIPGGPRGRNPHQVRPLNPGWHGIAEFRSAWQGWLLSPEGEERRLMFPRLRRALGILPHSSTIPVCLLAAEQLGREPKGGVTDVQIWNELRLSDAVALLDIVSVVQNQDSVLAILKMNRLALEHGYADAAVERRGAKSHFSRSVARLFSGRGYYTVDRAITSADEWASERNIVGDHWKDFKPILLGLQVDPEAQGLDEDDLAIIAEALRLMPDAPFPGKEE